MTPGDEQTTSTAHPEHETELEKLIPPGDKARAVDAITVAHAEDQPAGPWGQDETLAGNVQVTAPSGPESTTRLGAWTDAAPPAEVPIGDVSWIRERRENLNSTRPPRMTASAPVPRRLIEQRRQPCEHCGGSGFMPGLNDYLRESIALVGDQGDEVVRVFYSTLFRIAPETAGLFPADIVDSAPIGPEPREMTTEGKREMLQRAGLPFDDEAVRQADTAAGQKFKSQVAGRKQREKLLQALVALADLYDPDDPDKMGRLDRALGSFGRSHAAFARPDGTIRGATWEEYAAVKDALFQTLVRAAESAWKAEYTEAWSQAYDYAAAVMIAEQHRSGFSSPRFPRA